MCARLCSWNDKQTYESVSGHFIRISWFGGLYGWHPHSDTDRFVYDLWFCQQVCPSHWWRMVTPCVSASCLTPWLRPDTPSSRRHFCSRCTTWRHRQVSLATAPPSPPPPCTSTSRTFLQKTSSAPKDRTLLCRRRLKNSGVWRRVHQSSTFLHLQALLDLTAPYRVSIRTCWKRKTYFLSRIRRVGILHKSRFASFCSSTASLDCWFHVSCMRLVCTRKKYNIRILTDNCS